MRIIITNCDNPEVLNLTFRFGKVNGVNNKLKAFMIRGIKYTGNYRINNQSSQRVYKSDLPHVLTKLRDEIIKIETQNRA